MQSPSAKHTTIRSDLLDRTVYAMDALGNTTCYTYDIRNRKVAEYGAGVQPATFEYDDADNLTALTTWRDDQQVITTDPRELTGGDTTRWEYNDASGLEVRKTYANGLGSEMTCDAANRLETLRNARGELTSYTYNKLLGYVTKISFSDENTPQQTFKYNIADQPTQIVDAADTRVFTYNEYEQLDTETLTTEKTKFAVREAYDTFGRSTGYAFLKGNTAAHTVSTGYAEDGRIATAGFPARRHRAHVPLCLLGAVKGLL